MFIFLNIFWVFPLKQCVKNKNIYLFDLLRPITKRNPWSFKYSNSMEEAAMKMKKNFSPRKPHFYIDLHSTLTILMYLIYWRIMKPLLSLGPKLKLSQCVVYFESKRYLIVVGKFISNYFILKNINIFRWEIFYVICFLSNKMLRVLKFRNGLAV